MVTHGLDDHGCRGHGILGGVAGKKEIADVLANRYASAILAELWSLEYETILECKLQIAVLKAQVARGIEVPEGTIEAYEKIIDQVDLDSTATRERVTHYDVKACIEEFRDLIGTGHIHKGAALCGLTENVEQLQVLQSLKVVRDKAVAVTTRIVERVLEYQSLVMAGRSRNVAARAATLGRRFTPATDETLLGIERVEDLASRYLLRGTKGLMGTAQDMLNLLDGDESALVSLEDEIAEGLGFDRVFDSVGQVYPRILDFDAPSALVEPDAGPASLAITIRLMAGNGTITEDFKEGRVGSSVMPYRINACSCGRVHDFQVILRGYMAIISKYAGTQWSEGNVSYSVVRRVALSNVFFAIDDMFGTFLTVLSELGAFPAMIDRELKRYLPFLASTKILMAAVRAGMDHGETRKIIKEHAVATALDMYGKGVEQNLTECLAADERFPLNVAGLADTLANHHAFIGAAGSQVDRVVARVQAVVDKYPEVTACRLSETL